MPKVISPVLHGMIDYATVAAVVGAPHVLGFPKRARKTCQTLAGGYLGLSLCTRYPLGIKRVIPFKGHGVAEVAIGAVLPMLPRALGFGRHRGARTFFWGLTLLTAVTAVLTDWDA